MCVGSLCTQGKAAAATTPNGLRTGGGWGLVPFFAADMPMDPRELPAGHRVLQNLLPFVDIQGPGPDHHPLLSPLLHRPGRQQGGPGGRAALPCAGGHCLVRRGAQRQRVKRAARSRGGGGRASAINLWAACTWTTAGAAEAGAQQRRQLRSNCSEFQLRLPAIIYNMGT